MVLKTDSQKKLVEASRLLSGNQITLENFESVRVLVGGFHPKVDILLERCSSALSRIDNLKNGEIIELSGDLLPAETEEEKKRKKAIILFIKSYKDLRTEVVRINAEFSKNDSKADGQARTFGRIVAGAKGPFGIVTLIVLIIVAGTIFLNSGKGVSKTPLPPSPTPRAKIQVIIFNEKQIPLSELQVRNGPDCDSPHYHAKVEPSVKALDGTIITDPGGCAFGKVKDVQVLEVIP